jgi:hypothetical protein
MHARHRFEQRFRFNARLPDFLVRFTIGHYEIGWASHFLFGDISRSVSQSIS